ncbi:MAG: gamma-glutamyltransferase [Xanthobacteraceae bacterium]
MPNLKILPRRFCSLSLIVAAILPVAALAQDDQIPPAQGVLAQNGMVVAQESRAARIGNDILQRGGNAVDAAVAVGFALAVSYPRAGNLGGGGFMVIHLANVTDTTIDYRETAPSNINSKSFLDAQGNADPQKSRDSALAVGVPGTVAGLALAEDKYGSGRFTLAQLIAPAMQMARDGFTFEDDRAEALPNERARLVRWPSTVKIFFKADGNPMSYGDRLVQGDLAETLDAIAREGPSAFYEGPIADEIAAAVQAAGGVMTADDLGNYSAIERPAVHGTYRGYDIVSMPPPSSGGVGLIEMLNILEGYDLAHADQGQELHYLVEAMKRAYADRTLFLGDPDKVQNPVERLISKDYAAAWRDTVNPARATPASAIHAGGTVDNEGHNTTHFSVVDRFGNAVSNTYTLNFSFGLGLVAEGTGVLLNNELDDFAAKPNAPNAYGLLGAEANEPGPGKRPLSSMSPTILLKGGKPFLVTGSPGGSRIITTVLQVIVNAIDRHMDIAQAVSQPRLHNQWMPDQVYVEPSFPPALVDALRAYGDKVVLMRPVTSANSIMVTPQGIMGAADPRTHGALAIGN